MDRRTFLSAGKRRVAAGRPPRTQSTLDPYTGPWTANEVQHLLMRVGFGAPAADIRYFSSKTVAEAVAELLQPSGNALQPPVNDYNALTADPQVPSGATWVNHPTNDGTLNSRRRTSFKRWWMGRMLSQERRIHEKLILFWANFFGTESDIIGTAHYIYQHHLLLRQHALGNFKKLVKAVTIDAGMLRYLNGYLNSATAPDENYARELQELFTLGKGPSVQYTEQDVRAAARVLTGWRINGTTFSTYFDASRHDTKPKVFSGYYNGRTIAGRSGASGADETDELIEMIFQQEEVSRYICRRLYRWFVYYKIDTATEQEVIGPLAFIFRQHNYEIRPVLEALLQSQHFFDVANQGCLIKSPVDLVAGCVRTFGLAFPAATTDLYNAWSYIRNWTVSMGQDIGDPPDVSGWPAYYQAPQYHELWINSDTLPKRNRFTDTLVGSGYTINGHKLVIDVIAFARSLNNPADPNSLVAETVRLLLRVPLSANAQDTIKRQILLSNQTRDQYWTDAWNRYLSTQAADALSIVQTRLKALLQYLMNLPEYQLS